MVATGGGSLSWSGLARARPGSDDGGLVGSDPPRRPVTPSSCAHKNGLRYPASAYGAGWIRGVLLPPPNSGPPAERDDMDFAGLSHERGTRSIAGHRSSGAGDRRGRRPRSSSVG